MENKQFGKMQRCVECVELCQSQIFADIQNSEKLLFPSTLFSTFSGQLSITS